MNESAPPPLPPGPWKKYHSIIQVGMYDVFAADESMLAVVSPRVADLILRAPAVEAAARDAIDAWMQTTIAGAQGLPLCDAMIRLREALGEAK